MKRTALGLVLPLVLVAIVLVCMLTLAHAPARALLPAAAPDGLGDPVTVVFWHSYTGDREARMQALIDEFNATNPYSVTVVGEYAGSWIEIRDNVLLGIQAGGPLPNLVMGYPTLLSVLARHGAVRFLDSYLNDPTLGITDTADLQPGVLDYYRLIQYGNQLAGLQYGISIEAMFYNADLLAGAGLNVPQTWEAFESSCISLTTETVSGTIPGMDASRFATWLWSRGGQLLSDDGSHARFQEQPGIDSLLTFQQLVQGRYARLPQEQYEEIAAFGNGQVAMIFGSTSGIPYIRTAMGQGAGNDWGASRVPALPGHEVVDSYGAGAGIIHHDEDADRGAWLFLRWLVDRQQTARWAAASGYFPVRISAETHISMTQKLADDPQYAEAYALLPLSRSEPGVRGYETVRSFLKDAMFEILANGAEVTRTLQSAAAEVDAFLLESAPESTPITPEGGTLVYTGTEEYSATVEFPAGAMAVTETVTYIPLDDLPSDGLAFALVPNLTFSEPVTITLHYRDSDVQGMDEDELKLYLFDWAIHSWVDADPCGGYVRDPQNNILQAKVCHFSDYTLDDRPFKIYLPVTVRSGGP
jgi:ABC-type glycerol-3-phosphate transport system substrate-binding protein